MDLVREMRRDAVWNEQRLSLERWTFLLEHPNYTNTLELKKLRLKILALDVELGQLTRVFE